MVQPRSENKPPSLLGFAFWILKSVVEKAILVGMCLLLGFIAAIASWWATSVFTTDQATAILVAFVAGIAAFAISWISVLFITYWDETSGRNKRSNQTIMRE